MRGSFHAPRGSDDLRPLCRAREFGPRITKAYSILTCQNCLYTLEVNGRAQDLAAAVHFGFATLLAILYREPDEDIVVTSMVSAHFGLRLFEVAA